MTQVITNPAPAEVQIQLLLEDLESKKEELLSTKEILKEYKVESPHLTQLKQAKKELAEQIKEEAERIEGEFYEDETFEKAKNDELTYKNEIKEKVSELKQVMKQKYKVQELATERHLASGQQMKLQLDFSPKIYLNGKEIK